MGFAVSHALPPFPLSQWENSFFGVIWGNQQVAQSEKQRAEPVSAFIKAPHLE